MKQTYFILAFSFLTFSLTAQEVVKKRFEPKDIIQFDKYMVHLGDVNRGETPKIVYTFTNIGKEDLQIELISACDCTETDYPTLPVKPGDKGILDVTFHSDRKTKNDTIDIDIILTNINPDNGYQVIERVQYDYNLIMDDKAKAKAKEE